MSLQGDKFKLSDGTLIPAIGYGVGTKWYNPGGPISQELVDSLKLALDKGFVHIDGAEIYGTDRETGQVLKTVDRSKIYVVNKHQGGYAFENRLSPHGLPYESLKYQLEQDLQLEYVDLYLLHGPYYDIDKKHTLKEAWQSAERAVDDGLAKAIGVSNFAVENLQELLSFARIKPVVNQIEFNAYLQDQTPGIVSFTQKHGILVEAYSPLAPIYNKEPGELIEYLEELSKKHGKTPSQLLLRWVLQNNVLPVTTSGKEERIKQFLEIFDFVLSPEEQSTISELGKKHKPYRQYWNEVYAKYD